MQNQIHQWKAVLSKLYELVEEGVISKDDLSTDSIIDKGEKIPRIVVTVDQLYEQGYFAGLEDCVESFCYIFGASTAIEKIIKKNSTKKNQMPYLTT